MTSGRVKSAAQALPQENLRCNLLSQSEKMLNWQKIAFRCVIVWAVFALVGCSSTAPTPESSTVATTDSVETEVKPAAPPAAGISSLEALQRGESTATPAASPLQDIYFEFDSYDLPADTRETLKANAAWLRSNPAVIIDIEGHCDERGTNDYNMALGAKRAEAAMDYLTTLGVAAGRLSTTSYGEEVPVCAEHTEECWAKKPKGPLRHSAYTAHVLIILTVGRRNYLRSAR